ncbi:MAG TPA: hypothetical protein VH084_04355 [Mycobacterium sp.]|jgi:hypothetical protein|nr:hypothetical protein [Mycobacterium sp.]
MTCGYAGGVDGINTLPPCRRPDGMGALPGSATHPEGPDDLMFSGGQCGGGRRAQITSRAGDENLQYLFLRSLNLCVYVWGNWRCGLLSLTGHPPEQADQPSSAQEATGATSRFACPLDHLFRDATSVAGIT